ncbi:hypothetical protein GcM3_058022 [Golovinomyces cichoracearum]|uniref:Uncharacterized protein n=1 Tax=Golovinomyces cichoracearum TaxID=62708 RepID=A0A420IX12_9PEZI|nr:hypothetical protein GcM3_058022 [Golovinomyces cichoracearum]
MIDILTDRYQIKIRVAFFSIPINSMERDVHKEVLSSFHLLLKLQRVTTKSAKATVHLVIDAIFSYLSMKLLIYRSVQLRHVSK